MSNSKNLAALGSGFISQLPGSVVRTVNSKIQDTVSVKDFGAVGDGIVDDTAAVQAAITASNCVYFPAGTYLSASYFNLVKNDLHVFGDGDQTIFKSTDSTTQNIYTLKITGDNCTIENIKIDGNKDSAFPVVTQRDGVAIFGNNGLIRRVSTVNTVSAGIRIQGNNGLVSQCKTSECGDLTDREKNTAAFGIIMAVAEGGRIEACEVTNTTRSGIFVYNSSHVTIVGNTVVGAENGIRTDWLPETLGDIYATITGNVVYDCYGDAIRFTGNYVVVSGNVCKGSLSGGAGALSNGGYGQTVCGNSFVGNESAGVYIRGSSGPTIDCTVIGNTCVGNEYGIIVVPDSAREITNLFLSNNNCSNNTISDISISAAGVSSTARLSGNTGSISLNYTNWTYSNSDTSESVTADSTIKIGAANVYSVSGTSDIQNIEGGVNGQRVTLYFSGNSANRGVISGGNITLLRDFRYTFKSTLSLVKAFNTWIEISRSSPSFNTIPSASTISITSEVKVVQISGTADISNITGGSNSQEITLVFSGNAAANGVINGGNLRLAGNFPYTINSTLKLLKLGSNWLEVSRSLN